MNVNYTSSSDGRAPQWIVFRSVHDSDIVCVKAIHMERPPSVDRCLGRERKSCRSSRGALRSCPRPQGVIVYQRSLVSPNVGRRMPKMVGCKNMLFKIAPNLQYIGMSQSTHSRLNPSGKRSGRANRLSKCNYGKECSRFTSLFVWVRYSTTRAPGLNDDRFATNQIAEVD